jgi:ferric-dicitrate binding protein FerR (iron transport regulator)
MNSKKIIKILRGEASAEDKRLFFQKCENDPKLKEEYIRLKNLWVLGQKDKQQYKAKYQDEFWARVDESHQNKVNQIWRNVGKYAAAAAIFIGLFFLVQTFYQPSEKLYVKSFECPPGSINVIELNDGSIIKLNSGSKLELSQKTKDLFVANLQGEAYFDIIHNENRTFVVESDGYKIRDLGTIFNVKAHQSSDQICATLIEGKIDILGKDGSVLRVMKPDEHCVINKESGQIESESIVDKRYFAWTDGELVFIEANIEQVVEKLRHRYGANIHLEDSKYWSEFQLTATFKDESLIEVLDIISYLNELSYDIDEKRQQDNRVQINLYKK